MSEQLTDLLERAAWTFAQGFLGALAVGGLAVDDLSALGALLIGAVGAGLSAIKTGVKNKRNGGA